MDSKKNPLVNPPDIALKAALHLEQEPSFVRIREWLDSCLAHASARLPYGKDEVEHRWTQGQVQALSLIIGTLSNPRAGLVARANEAAQDALPRNF